MSSGSGSAENGSGTISSTIGEHGPRQEDPGSGTPKVHAVLNFFFEDILAFDGFFLRPYEPPLICLLVELCSIFAKDLPPCKIAYYLSWKTPP